MNLLARLAADGPTTWLALTVLVPTTTVILVVALIARVFLGRRAAERHGLWLGALIWVLLSPAVSVVAGRVGFALWVVNLPAGAAGVEKAAGRAGPGPSPAIAKEVHGTARDFRDAVGRGAAATGRIAGPGDAGIVPFPEEPTAPAPATSPAPDLADHAATSPGPALKDLTPRGGIRRADVARGLAAAWAAGVLIGLARLAVGGWRLARILRAARPLVPAQHVSMLEPVRAALGAKTLPPVVTSRAVAGPVAVGLIRPRVVLPEGLPVALSARELRDVLVHECAHVLRRDPWVGLLQRVAAALFWPDPLVHYLNGQLSRAREEVCDNHVIRCGDARDYARTLLTLTELCRPPDAARAGIGLLTARWTLADRVAGLLDPGRMPMTKMNARTRVALAAVLAAAGLAVAGVRLDRTARAQVPETAREEPTRERAPATKGAVPDRTEDAGLRIARAGGAEQGRPVDGRAFALTVVDRGTGIPIPDVTVKAQVNRQESDLTTDALGRLAIALPDAVPEYVMIRAEADGYVPVYVAWSRAGDAISVPVEYTLRMERGTTIGGLIQDEEGRPVAGATVYLLVPGQDRPGEPRVSLWDYPVRTDERGRWRCDLVPAELDDVWIRLAHPDYISDNTYGRTPRPTIAQLRDHSGAMVMKKGPTVTGRVVDADSGRPIAGADVAQGSDRFGTHYPETKTDADGRFEFRNVEPGEMVLTVRAKGYAPDLKTLAVAPGAEPVTFRLGPGRTIRGRLVDPRGQPVAGAFVAADTWRGHRSLEWRVGTDAQGRFRWDEAPPDAVLVDMGQEGFLSARRRSMIPSDDESTITLARSLSVRGTVVDAATGEPVEAFTLVPGINWSGNGAPSWQRERARATTGGRYEIRFSEPYPMHLVRIEASGYRSAVSRAFKPEEGDQVFDFRLEGGRDVVGVVRLLDGTPLAGADVVLLPAGQNLSLQEGRLLDRRGHDVIKTDTEGRFRFPPQDGEFTLIAWHDRGYARSHPGQFAEAGAVVVRPWGRIEGTLRVGGKPAVGEQVALQAATTDQPLEGSIGFSSRASTDADGRFAFDRVPPGRASVSRVVRLNERLVDYTQSTPVQVEPGQTAHVDVGGT